MNATMAFVIAVVHQSHLALEIVDVVLQILSWLHSNREDMVVSLELSPRSKLIVEGVSYIIKTPKRVFWEQVEPMVGDALEAKREHSKEEQVIVGVDIHLVLKLSDMKGSVVPE